MNRRGPGGSEWSRSCWKSLRTKAQGVLPPPRPRYLPPRGDLARKVPTHVRAGLSRRRIDRPRPANSRCPPLAPLRHHGQARGPDPRGDLGREALPGYPVQPVLVRSEEQAGDQGLRPSPSPPAHRSRRQSNPARSACRPAQVVGGIGGATIFAAPTCKGYWQVFLRALYHALKQLHDELGRKS